MLKICGVNALRGSDGNVAAPLIVAALLSGIDAVAIIDAVPEARNPQWKRPQR